MSPEPDKTERTARCACGALTIHCRGEPDKVSACHCEACRRRTGSAFGIAVFFRREAARPEGPSNVFERGSDSGHPVTFHFCPTCGSTVYWYPARMPDRVAVGLGGFGDPAFPGPTQQVFEAMRQPWVGISPGG